MKNARLVTLAEQDYGKKYTFAVTPKFSKRTYVLVAESEGEREEWLMALIQHGAHAFNGGINSSLPTSSSSNLNIKRSSFSRSVRDRKSSDMDSPISQNHKSVSSFFAGDGGDDTKIDPRTIKEGFLIKQGATVKNWKRRYFALFPHSLVYFKHKGDASAAGEISLRAGGTVEIEDLNITTSHQLNNINL